MWEMLLFGDAELEIFPHRFRYLCLQPSFDHVLVLFPVIMHEVLGLLRRALHLDLLCFARLVMEFGSNIHVVFPKDTQKMHRRALHASSAVGCCQLESACIDCGHFGSKTDRQIKHRKLGSNNIPYP